MIIAKTKCCDCGAEIELSDEYGWTKEDNGRKFLICVTCDEGEKLESEGIMNNLSDGIKDGFALFYLKGIAPADISMGEIYKSVTPFILVNLAVLIICMIFPDIVLWLPNKVMG